MLAFTANPPDGGKGVRNLFGVDSADRLLAFTANPPGMGNQNLLTNPQYNAVGMVQAALGNGLTETRGYNSRTWLQSLSVGSVYSLGLTYAGNGNVVTANDSENGNWAYGYDGANRLHTASRAGQAFTYNPDTWGNMTCTNTGSLPCTPQGLSFNTSTNRITTSGYNYDAAGNLLSDSTHSYNYDAENRITCVLDAYGQCSQNAVQYLYDANGQRVGKQQGNTLEDYVYDPQGHTISVHDGSANLLRSELYSPDGRHAATWNSNGLFYNHADWLGTERVRTNSSGSFVQGFTDTPYGMNLAYNPASDVSPMHFTGKQRDSESGLDNFGARYFGGGDNLGRFMTPDPKILTSRHIMYPQKWNKYAYVRNNPLAMVDPDGADDFFVFLPLANNVSSQWAAIRAEAPKYGNTVTIYPGAKATTGNYESALQTPGAHVIDAGHTVDDNTGHAVGVLLGNNQGVGDPTITTLPLNGQAGGPLVPVGNVQAADVAVFGCNSTDLQGQYSGTTFTGTQPTTNTQAEDAGARTFTDTLVRGGTVDQASGAAQQSMQNTTDQANANPSKPMTYSPPQICSFDASGTKTCH